MILHCCKRMLVARYCRSAERKSQAFSEAHVNLIVLTTPPHLPRPRPQRMSRVSQEPRSGAFSSAAYCRGEELRAQVR